MSIGHRAGRWREHGSYAETRFPNGKVGHVVALPDGQWGALYDGIFLGRADDDYDARRLVTSHGYALRRRPA